MTSDSQPSLPAPDDRSTESPPDQRPERIGNYRILQKIGEGGMGIVYLAEQESPVCRRLAVKVIKPGMDSKQVLARFDAERQALALMNHPGIAKVFDVGSTPEGLPFFVMEYVQGLPITEYCDRQRLDNRRRLALFIEVCEAIQHAHHKGIIHRDIKPSNVLIAVADGVARPTVIDFGVAKAIQQPLTARTLFTQLGVLIGTPEYMSPEQANLDILDIDVRSDVYSLGVLLYELLVGALPFEPSELRKVGFDEIRRRIREDEPPRPSARVSTMGARSSESARRRRTEARSLRRELLGDLDWITMRALDKERDRRYGSPSELADDIRRHLRLEPVLARAPTARYRARKFVQRHRVGVAAVALVVAGLSVGTVLSTVGLLRARRAEARALVEARTREHVSRYLKDLFDLADPSDGRGNRVTARELLDKAAATLNDQLSYEPEVHAELATTIGEAYMGLGLARAAEAPLRNALEIRSRTLGPQHPDTLQTAYDLGLSLAGTDRWAEAEQLLSTTLEARKRVLGLEHPDTAACMTLLGSVYHSQQRMLEAEQLYAQALEIQKRTLGPEHRSTLKTMNYLARFYLFARRHVDAQRVASSALEISSRVLGPEHPETLTRLFTLASVLESQGKYVEAERIYGAVLKSRTRALGREHVQTIMSMQGLANMYLLQKRYSDGAVLFSESLEVARRVLGDRNRLVAAAYYNLGCASALQGDRGAAMQWLHKAVQSGFARVSQISTDSDLGALHGREFDEILDGVRQNFAEQTGISVDAQR